MLIYFAPVITYMYMFYLRAEGLNELKYFIYESRGDGQGELVVSGEYEISEQ